MLNLQESKIIYGDCNEVLKEIPDNSIDLVLTDPPYLYRSIKSSSNSKLSKSIDKAFSELSDIRDGVSLDFCKEIIRIQEKVNCYIWCSKDQIIDYLNFFVKEHNCSFDVLWWYKNNAMPTFNNKYLTDKEYCLYFRKGGYCMPSSYDKAKTLFLEPINIKDKKLYDHPTIKPLKIFETLIENSTKEGDIVLDCFSGSGTTALACHNLRRRYICIEKNEKYYTMSLDRLNNATAQQKLNLF